MKRIAILGLGLMGGSLGLAVRETGLAGDVRGYARRAETRRRARRIGAVDAVFDTPAAAVEGADLVVLCVPVLSTGELLESCRAFLAPGTVVTDVGSTKTAVERMAARALLGTQAIFVGSHPMAGSEETGIAAARRDLYRGATVIVTPGRGRVAERRAAVRVARFWQRLGCRVVHLSAVGHDRLVARTSHLPHMVAAALVAALHRDGGRRERPLCGQGFRDTTRVAAGSAEMWHDIVRTNRLALGCELAGLGRELGRLAGLIERGEFEAVRQYLERCSRLRVAMEGDAR